MGRFGDAAREIREGTGKVPAAKAARKPAAQRRSPSSRVRPVWLPVYKPQAWVEGGKAAKSNARVERMLELASRARIA